MSSKRRYVLTIANISHAWNMTNKRRVNTIVAVCSLMAALYIWFQLLPLGYLVFPKKEISSLFRKVDYTKFRITRVFNSELNQSDDIQYTGLTKAEPLETNNETLKRGNKKTIIMYTLEGLLKKKTKEWGTFMSKCGCGNCELINYNSYDNLTTESLNADAIVFQGAKMKTKIPSRRNKDQVFIFSSLESAFYCMYTDLTKSVYNNFYNWTMTYRLDSDIPIPYGQIIPVHYNLSLSNQTCYNNDQNLFLNISNPFHHFDEHLKKMENQPFGISGKNYSAIFRMKCRSAVWLSGHCVTASIREVYIKRMQQSINVDIFGECGNETSKNACKRGPKCEQMIIENYKFILAFENSLCDDYITEKVYQWFSKDIVLVVRGARKYHRYLPRGTYVDTEDFDTPWKLAVYLEQLAQNENEYVRMLKLKDNFKVVSHVDIMNAGFCELCKRLHGIEAYRKSYKDIGTWWGGHCTMYL